MAPPRYRTGVDRRTGRPLRGWPHCAQSIEAILTTQIGERWMRLDLGADVVRPLGRNIVPSVVLQVYSDIVTAVHSQEPEYRITGLQLVRIERTGGLGLRLWGDYYPEGRLGNYAMIEPRDGMVVVVKSALDLARVA